MNRVRYFKRVILKITFPFFLLLPQISSLYAQQSVYDDQCRTSPSRCTQLALTKPNESYTRPSHSDLARTAELVRTAVPPTGAKRIFSNASVIKPSFEMIAGSKGRWRGHVQGTGTVHLNLLFFSGEQLVERRYLGSVKVSASEKPVAFRFETSIPTGMRKIQWRILAGSEI